MAYNGWLDDLILEYKHNLKVLKEIGGHNDMERELQQAIKWMETGYDPAEYRAENRKDVIPIDPYHMQAYMTQLNLPQQMNDYMINLELYSEDECEELEIKQEFEEDVSNKEKIKAMLKGLTPDEKTVFIAIRAENMTFSKVAKMMGIKRSTVQGYLRRAEEKVTKNRDEGVQQDLFEF